MKASQGRLAEVNLVVPPAHLAELENYYEKLLGMTRVSSLERTTPDGQTSQHVTFGYTGSPESCAVTFLACPSATSIAAVAVYWKIGLSLEDVDAAGLAYKQNGGGWSGADQFLDVGYLGHTADPSGYCIEFLQTTFEDNPAVREERKRAAGMAPERPLAQRKDPVVGQITLKASDVEKTNDFYTNFLGMKLLCIEPVTPYGFELYFYGFTDENPPVPGNLKDVKNREWTYQRPYTTLEIQFQIGGGAVPDTDHAPGQGGFDSISVCLPGGKYAAIEDELDEDGCIRDPNGIKVRVLKCK